MGRLFWKFFFILWIAQLVGGGSVALIIWLKSPGSAPGDPDASPRAVDSVAAAAALLRHADVAALREYLADTHPGPARRVLVVDQFGHELFGRTPPPEALARARQLAEGPPVSSVARVRTADGEYVLFVAPHEHPLGGAALGMGASLGGAPGGFAAGAPGGPPLRGEHPGPPPPILHFFAAAVVSLLFAALLAAYMSRPIRSLRSAFQAVAEGDLERRLGPEMGRRRDELADLGKDFDLMAARLQALVQGQRHLLHDVSHELRSPLARLQAAIGLARQQPERVADSLFRVEREGVRIEQLVSELLTLSRLEVGMAVERGEPVVLAELLADVVDDARLEGEARQIEVALHAPGDAVVAGDGELLRRAVDNVVRNAVQHSPAGGHVVVDLRTAPAGTDGAAQSIVVSDEGPGVAEDDLARIFDPFFRSKRVRAATTAPDGHGLGLAIARRVILAHGGRIHAANGATGGFRLVIELPAVPPSSLTSSA
ncbi:HAMP domain-containing histidine kinase [Rhodocyclus tenuis]|uniref:histidine kinase n=1 Tax=Rhodocyclus gracilis TaxID=2929842 RepID=A0ABX0WI72_9RHOO|nr:HAMP domain-containing sensor histidine kinase [Rhodocyclus gracilis]NJA88522.1 HAMP domain-containing histidine kinase [Rhodocyclus gracilis]